MKVLIAEDDTISRRLLEATLKKRGYDVIVTCDGDEAWNELQKIESPQIAVLDWMMPNLDGIDVCRKVRESENGRYKYLILLTAKGSKEDIAVGLDAGADDYIIKPFHSGELFGRVQVGERIIHLQNELADHVDRLKELDRLKSDFLSTVSHELRTPLAVMRGGVSLCLDGIAGDISETQRDLLSDALDNIDRLTRLITDLLDISKIEAGKFTLHRSTIDLCELIRKTVQGFDLKAHEKEIKLCLSLPENPVKIFADGDKITQIINNLISNALRFTRSNGRIDIRIQENECEVECQVKDTGVGIAKENLPKLFSKFEQFRRIDGPGYKGTGLGLAIAKGLVEKHGGCIWAESELEKGTAFSFTLAKVPFPKILIVDDSQRIVDLVKRFLSVENYQLLEAFTGKEALKKAEKENPSLIVLDLIMPGMTGYDVMDQLKKNDQTKNIPILILSAASIDEERIEKIARQPIPVLGKPIKPQDLLNSVKEMLREA